MFVCLIWALISSFSIELHSDTHLIVGFCATRQGKKKKRKKMNISQKEKVLHTSEHIPDMTPDVNSGSNWMLYYQILCRHCTLGYGDNFILKLFLTEYDIFKEHILI